MRRARPAHPALLVAVWAALLLAVGTQAASAAPVITYVSGNTIRQAGSDGTVHFTLPLAGSLDPQGVAVAMRTGDIYWANNGPGFFDGSIGRARLDGSDSDVGFIPLATQAEGVAADANHVYWSNGNGQIARARLDGSDVELNFITGANYPRGIAVDAGHVYWADYGSYTIGRANIDGTGVDQSFISAGTEPHGVTVSPSHVYWSNSNGGPHHIGRANLDGTGADVSWLSPSGLVRHLSNDGTHLYWANYDQNAIGRVNLDGTGSNDTFIGATSQPVGVAASWTPAASLTGDGTLGERVPGSVPAPRNLTLTGTGDGPLMVGTAALTGADASQFRIAGDTCSGRNLAAGATCTVAVSFAPASNGSKTATLTIPGDTPGSPATLPLSGTGVPAPVPVPVPTPMPGPAPTPIAPVLPATAVQSRSDLSRATIITAAPGAGTLTLRAEAKIGGRTVALPATAGTAVTVLTLPARVRAQLAERGRVTISVTATFAASAGGTATDRRAMSLTAAASRFLRSQWIGRTLGPWAEAPHLTGARRAALRIGSRGDVFTARVVR